MFVRDVGRGPSVLLLHGTPSPATDWMPLADRLASRFRVLVPDLPGYGRSEPLASSSMEAVGDALAAMLRDHGVTELRAIAGYSTGVYRALDLALRIPTELVVALSGMAYFDEAARELRRGLATRFEQEPAFFTSPEVGELMRGMMLSPPYLAAHPEVGDRVADWLKLTTREAIARELHALAGARDLRPELAALRASVYIRVGELDVGAPPAWSEAIAAAVPASRLDVVPGCGHAILIEDARATIEALYREIAG